MRIHIAHAIDPQTDEAVLELLDQMEGSLRGASPVAGVLFLAIRHAPSEVLPALRARYPTMVLIGCTTDGELSSVAGLQQDSIVLAVFEGTGVTATAALAREVSTDPPRRVREAVEAAGGSEGARCVIALSESLTASAVKLLDAVVAAFPPGVQIVGGTAGDQRQFSATWQICGDEAVHDGVAMLILRGDIAVAVGVASGWKAVGPAGRVTRSEDHVVHEIDGLPATRFYRQYFGESVLFSPDHPMYVSADPERGFCLRAPLRVGEGEGAVTFAGDVPEGAVVRVTTASRPDILEGCRASVRNAVAQGQLRSLYGVLVVTCAARRMLLGTDAEHETRILRDSVGLDVPVFGFYSYGEFGATTPDAPADFHNETFITVLFGGLA